MVFKLSIKHLAYANHEPKQNGWLVYAAFMITFACLRRHDFWSVVFALRQIRPLDSNSFVLNILRQRVEFALTRLQFHLNLAERRLRFQ